VEPVLDSPWQAPISIMSLQTSFEAALQYTKLKMTPSFKLGWVTGYAKAMDLADTIQMSTCAYNLPLYKESSRTSTRKTFFHKMCASNTELQESGRSGRASVVEVSAASPTARQRDAGAGESRPLSPTTQETPARLSRRSEQPSSYPRRTSRPRMGKAIAMKKTIPSSQFSHFFPG
jgi:hypothetical protein